MKTYFDLNWKNWINTNVDAGRDKNGIFKILLDEGYDYSAIQQEMNFEPTIPVSQLINPLQPQQQEQAQHQSNCTVKYKQKQLFIPNAQRYNSDKVELYLLEDFLNKSECQKVVGLIKSKLQPSTISGQAPDPYFRTSRTCHLGKMDAPFMQEIDQRICKILGIDPSYAEVIQGQYYQVGQEFKAHTDYFEVNEMETYGGKAGQRTYTFMIYLNDVEAGGETKFPHLNYAFKPTMGAAVIWNSLNTNGSTNEHTLHHALPVIKGYKAVITKWFRCFSNRSPAPDMYTKEAQEYIPNYTQQGFLKQTFPTFLFKEVTDFYHDNLRHEESEHVPGEFIFNQDKGTLSSSVVQLTTELRNKIHDVMKPILEVWCGQALEATYVYGIRVYKNKAVLKPHRDRLQTHIISAIINVDQVTNEDWPLLIEDNYYREHYLMLKPGEMVFYEGARLKHGRPVAFNGDCYANIFCHFKPVLS